VSRRPASAALRHQLGSLVGRPRRHHFLRRMPHDAVAAEIGVFRGEFTRRILESARPSELHLIDGWWEIHGETFPFEWGAYSDWGRLETRAAYEEVRRVIAGAPAGVICELHVGDDLEILERFDDDHFDWVYLDSSHQFEHTLAELRLLDRKVKPEGRIAGHDWIEDPEHVNHGACRAIREFCSTHGWTVTGLDRFTQWEIRRASRADS
jgi:SAM-dependent methyltransferase